MIAATRFGWRAACGSETIFERLVTGSDERELRAGRGDGGQGIEQQIHPFWNVRRETTPSSRASASRSSPNRACSGRPVRRRRDRRFSSKRAGSDASVAGFQMASSMPFRMPLSTPARLRRGRRDPCRPPASDLHRVGRRYGGDAVGQRQSRLEVADRSVIFDAVDRVRVRRQADAREEIARETVPGTKGCAPSSPSQAAATRDSAAAPDESRLPIVTVHDVGRVAATAPRAIAAAALASAAKRTPLSGHSCPSGPT
jgi:hypothetical protein